MTMVCWQMKEIRLYGVDMTNEARAILAGIKASKLDRIAAWLETMKTIEIKAFERICGKDLTASIWFGDF